MDALAILLLQLTVRIVLAIGRLVLMASILFGQGLGWLCVAAWRGWQRQLRRTR